MSYIEFRRIQKILGENLWECGRCGAYTSMPQTHENWHDGADHLLQAPKPPETKQASKEGVWVTYNTDFSRILIHKSEAIANRAAKSNNQLIGFVEYGWEFDPQVIVPMRPKEEE